MSEMRKYMNTQFHMYLFPFDVFVVESFYKANKALAGPKLKK